MQNIVENSSFDDLNKRGSNLLKTGTYSDCSFLVGTDDNKRNIAGHKQILAMGSPVFERMLYGDLASNDDGSPIEITDIQPDAFMGMLEYIYAHQITIENFDRACSLCYLADKYMLPSLFESCVDFIMKNLKASTACRAYELAKLLNKPKLLAKSLEIINKETSDVLNDPSFIDIEPSTLMDILNEDSLNITELELFNALVKYANAATDSGDASKLALFTNLPFSVKDEPADEETLIRKAVKKICFLTITAQEFVDVVACSNILTQTEACLILSKIVSPKNTKISMPDGFATEMMDRKNRPRRCCSYHGAYSCVLANCSR